MNQQKGTHRLRKGRISRVGQYYLLTTATYSRIPIFTRHKAAKIVLSSLHWLDEQGRIALEAAVVMPDHLHFVAELRSDNLSKLMQSLKGYTSRKINRLFNRKGPVWQPQYHDHAIRTYETLKEVTIYCLHNPVRAELVSDFHDYPFWYCRWSV